MTLTLELISQDDIPAVAALAGAAFREDAVHMPILPPGVQSTVYDDVGKHSEWMKGKVYYKCSRSDCLVGSLILEIEGEAGSIFGLNVEPDHMNQGIGSWILCRGMEFWPQVTTWSLETPDYAIRNHHFYEKNGFVKVAHTPVVPIVGFGFIRYEKRTQQGAEPNAVSAGYIER